MRQIGSENDNCLRQLWSMGGNSPYSQNITYMEPNTTFYAKHLLCLVLLKKKNYSVIVYAHVVIGFDMEVQPLAIHNAA